MRYALDVGIVLSLCGLIVAGCASTGGPTIDLNKVAGLVSKSQYAFSTIDEEEELEIGSGLASMLLGAAPLVDNQEVQDYVNDVGMWLALQTERADLPWRFGVLEPVRDLRLRCKPIKLRPHGSFQPLHPLTGWWVRLEHKREGIVLRIHAIQRDKDTDKAVGHVSTPCRDHHTHAIRLKLIFLIQAPGIELHANAN